ncbi:hypothetical protein SAMN04489713_109269 [Actinomadura madurae]|uniref:Uncharacterized protein n=1 Tax=Actinomadura madurae TaxID=1993 RepID=A0A1I5JZF7_9ACTN|nr:hypothetical protein SAMN04489713_109269 [Actinomadura madurae]SPT56800.1 Uncharacterised protein [Actinomadura madurae]
MNTVFHKNWQYIFSDPSPTGDHSHLPWRGGRLTLR